MGHNIIISVKLSDSIVPNDNSKKFGNSSTKMYKIKYEKNRTGTLTRALLLVLFFSAGVFSALLGARFYISNKPPTGEEAETVEMLREYELPEEEKPTGNTDSGEREVWISGIEVSGYISEGDRIDVRTVSGDGKDEKLLAGKCITGIDGNGIVLLVKEEELPGITEAFMKMEGGSVIKAYAVRIP